MKTACFFLCVISMALLSVVQAEILKNARGVPVRYGGDYAKSPVDLPALKFRSVQFRAAWCAVVKNLDFPRCADEKEFKKNFYSIISMIKCITVCIIIYSFYPKN